MNRAKDRQVTQPPDNRVGRFVWLFRQHFDHRQHGDSAGIIVLSLTLRPGMATKKTSANINQAPAAKELVTNAQAMIGPIAQEPHRLQRR